MMNISAQATNAYSKLSKQKRLVSLDALRAIAIILVLFRHIQIIFPYMEGGPYPSSLLNILIDVGWVGVDLFFVISGYLITGLLFHEKQTYGNVSIRRFFIRRGFKIYPQYYVFLLVSTLPLYLHLDLPMNSLLGEIFFMQNYIGPIQPHTWSLAVEEHFYTILCLAFLLFRLCKNLLYRFPALSFATILTCMFIRHLRVETDPSIGWHELFSLTHLRIESLLVGSCIAYFKFYKSPFFKKCLKAPHLFACIALILFAPNVFLQNDSAFICIYGFTLNALGSAAIIFMALSFENRLNDSTCRFLYIASIIGRTSYGIYLWHVVVARSLSYAFCCNIPEIAGILEAPVWVTIVLYFLLSIMTGIAFTLTIEKPFLLMRDRYFPARIHFTSIA